MSELLDFYGRLWTRPEERMVPEEDTNNLFKVLNYRYINNVTSKLAPRKAPVRRRLVRENSGQARIFLARNLTISRLECL